MEVRPSFWCDFDPSPTFWVKKEGPCPASGSRSTNTAVVTATKTRTEPKWQENVGSFTGTQEKKKKRLIHMRWVGHFQVCKWSLAIGVARLKPKSHMHVKTGRTSITSKKLWLWWTYIGVPYFGTNPFSLKSIGAFLPQVANIHYSPRGKLSPWDFLGTPSKVFGGSLYISPMNVTFAKQRLFDHTGWWCLIAREHKNIGKKKTTILTPKKRNFDTVFNGNFSIFGGSCENQRLGLPASGSLSREPPWDIVPALQPRVNGKIIGLQPPVWTMKNTELQQTKLREHADSTNKHRDVLRANAPRQLMGE